jgi:transcription antitermination protein NusB
MTTRRRAREVVLQVLYEDDLNPTRDPKFSDEFLCARLLNNKPLVAFARELLEGIRSNRATLDSNLAQHSANWSVKRMAALDRNILRLATYEMTLAGVPGRVAINEAVDLAKRYGDKNSGPFVNGLLDRVYREFTGQSADPDVKELETAEDESPTPNPT